MGNVVRYMFVRAWGPEQTYKGTCFVQLEPQNSLALGGVDPSIFDEGCCLTSWTAHCMPPID